MNHTLFISDLHLEPSRPDITAWFLKLLQFDAPKADALYILGDLFEVWVGDDYLPDFNQSIAAVIRTVSDQGIPVYYMPGNRDFLLGETFAQAAGWQMLADPTKINLYGKSILLSHGDMLCTEDYKHQAFRKYAQNPKYNRFFLKLPLFMRQWIARLLRNASKKHTSQIDYAVMDVTPSAVEQILQTYQVTQLIHGHTHRPHIHEFLLNGVSAQRIVLGDWHNHGSALVYYADGKFELSLLD